MSKTKLDNGYYWVSTPGSTDYAVLLHKDGDWFDTWENTWVADYLIDGAIVERATMPKGSGIEYDKGLDPMQDD